MSPTGDDESVELHRLTRALQRWKREAKAKLTGFKQTGGGKPTPKEELDEADQMLITIMQNTKSLNNLLRQSNEEDGDDLPNFGDEDNEETNPDDTDDSREDKVFITPWPDDRDEKHDDQQSSEEDGDDLPNFGDEDNEVDLQDYGQNKKPSSTFLPTTVKRQGIGKHSKKEFCFICQLWTHSHETFNCPDLVCKCCSRNGHSRRDCPELLIKREPETNPDDVDDSKEDKVFITPWPDDIDEKHDILDFSATTVFSSAQDRDPLEIQESSCDSENESNGIQMQTKAKRFTFRPNSRQKLLLVQYYRQHYKKLKHDWTPNHSTEDYFKEWKAYVAHVKR